MHTAGGTTGSAAKRQRISEALQQKEVAKRRLQESTNSKYAQQLESFNSRNGGGALGSGFLDALTFSKSQQQQQAAGPAAGPAPGRLRPTGLSRRGG